MAIAYPENIGLARPGVDVPKIPLSEGINYTPLWLETKLDFFTPPGTGSGIFFGFMAQLGKWGYEAVKIDESVEVSPVFQQYYQLTIAQKQQMEGQIKQSLASIGTSIADLDLVRHDWRKYKEFMDYYSMLEEGRKLAKGGKTAEGKALILRGDQSLKAVFIDQVDVHTGETIALKLIAPRWPTIIADFMKLEDGDLEQRGIKEKYGISEAEAVVLATKNRLYVEWRDGLFRSAVNERFRSLTEMLESRKKSVMEYKNMARPLIARYKLITQALEQRGVAGVMQKVASYLPGAQATSSDNAKVWAWKPFSPSEKYRHTREVDQLIMAWRAGFRAEEVSELKRIFREDGKRRTLSSDEKIFLEQGLVKALPMEPSMDNVLRKYMKAVEKEYGVELTIMDLFNVRKKLLGRFEQGMRGAGGESWVPSPYYIMFEFPIARLMMRLPNGTEAEDFAIDSVTVSIQSQNMILLRQLELMSKEKALDNYIRQMLGEMGVSGASIDELERTELYKTAEEKEKEAEVRAEREALKTVMKEERWWPQQAFLRGLHNFFRYFGIDIEYLTTYGKYEFSKERVEKQYVKPDITPMFFTVTDWLKKAFQVPIVQ